MFVINNSIITIEMNQILNRFYATEETLIETGCYGVVHIYTDVNGITKSVILKDRFSSMEKAKQFAQELNYQKSETKKI